MATKKQRRRRQKGRRHEYEYVLVDEDGNEVEADEDDVEVSSGGVDPDGKGSRGPRAAAAGSTARTRGGRIVQPPSWRRVGRRALIFAPFMFLVISLTASELSPQARVVQTLFFMLIFLPFSYVMDSVVYRRFQKQAGQPQPRASGRGR